MAGFDFDLFVIGGGSGGVRAARRAAGFGASVALAERAELGGTCVHLGCVPKKLLHHAASVPDALTDAAGFGWSLSSSLASSPRLDWPRLRDSVKRETARLGGLYGGTLEAAGVEVLRGEARIEGAQEVSLGGRMIRAERVLYAAGSHPLRPDHPAGGEGWISDDLFSLSQIPACIAVMGGGYIACEFASIFKGLGAEVSLIYRGPRLVRRFDPWLSEGLTEALAASGIHVHLGAGVVAVERGQGGGAKSAEAKGAGGGSGGAGGKSGGAGGESGGAKSAGGESGGAGGESGGAGGESGGAKGGGGFIIRNEAGALLAETHALLWATGRAPDLEGLGAARTSVRMAEGKIEVDGAYRTNLPWLFALGDATGRGPDLTPVAIKEAECFAAKHFGPGAEDLDYACVPTAVFTHPVLATAGLSQEEARARGLEVRRWRGDFRPLKLALSEREERTRIQALTDAKSGRLLGVEMLGEEAAELAQVFALAIQTGVRKSDLDAAFALHPTVAEEFLSLREAD